MRLIYSIIITLCCIAFFSSEAYGALLNDSMVVVLADWNKNEKHTFRYSQYTYEIIDNDTIIKSRYVRDFIVVVDDSTQHLYSLKYNRLDMPSKGDSLAIDEQPLQLMTNHNGALIKVLNWDAFLAWRKNDVGKTSDDLMPFVSMLSFNGKKLRLNYDYRGSQIVAGHEVLQQDSVKSVSNMIVSRDFIDEREYDLITINTSTNYYTLNTGTSIPLVDKFTQIVDSKKGWALATYSERRRKFLGGEEVLSWNIKLVR